MGKVIKFDESFNIKVSDRGETVEIDIYGDIGDSAWGEDTVTAREFLDAVRSADGRDIELHVNSAGGSVFDAYAMMAALRAHGGHVTAHIDGIAASAASYLVAAADEVLIARDAWMMIHDASACVLGNAADMRECAEFLDKIDAQIADIYAERSEAARGSDYYADAMRATTWYTAEEAVNAGLADAVEDTAATKIAATADKATLDSAPDGVKAAYKRQIRAFPAVTADKQDDAGDGGQEPEPTKTVQEHVERIGDKIIVFKKES